MRGEIAKELLTVKKYSGTLLPFCIVSVHYTWIGIGLLSPVAECTNCLTISQTTCDLDFGKWELSTKSSFQK